MSRDSNKKQIKMNDNKLNRCAVFGILTFDFIIPTKQIFLQKLSYEIIP